MCQIIQADISISILYAHINARLCILILLQTVHILSKSVLLTCKAVVNPGALPVFDDALNDHFRCQTIATVDHLELATFLCFLHITDLLH